jgi:dihydroorotase
MKPGDILAHPFTRHPGGFLDAAGKVHPVVWEAIERGVRVDVGHGSHFSFDMAKRTLDAGIMPFTLGADLHGLNVRVPGDSAGKEKEKESNPFYGVAPFSLAIAMTELVTLGVPLVEVVKMVTTNAAAILGMEGELGTLKPGSVADVSVLSMRSGRCVLRDNKRAEVVADKLIEPLFCLRAGHYHEADSPLLPRLSLAA